jgi:hypothetical protein
LLILKGLSLPKPRNTLDWALLLGGAVVGGYILKTFVFGNHGIAHANFANSSNSIYPVHDTDVGDSMNAIVPTARQKYSTLLPHFHPGHHHGHGDGPHRSFPDYTDRANCLPATFLDHNTPHDSFNIGANLSNVIDKCAYVQTLDGNSFGSP